MTTATENEILTRVGPGSSMGNLMRQFWIPAAMSSELEADGDPMRLKLLGEKLIAFRDTGGKVGIMDHRCPHRCASLFFGRNEEGGIRCVYHGWKFDTEGNCLDMANVPPHQDFKHKVHAKAYRTAEQNGLIWVFMGDQANVPALPPIEVTLVPFDQRRTTFCQRDCNWLQALEGDIDTSHNGILHLGKVDTSMFLEGETNIHAVANRIAEFDATETETGAMYVAHRPADGDPDTTYWRLGQFLFPFWTMAPITPITGNVLAFANVPIDDTHTMCISMIKNDAYPSDRDKMHERMPGASINFPFVPNGNGWNGRWRVDQNAQNDYKIDRGVQRNLSMTGIDSVPMQDQMVTESMGAIVDRTREHPGPSDLMIARTRRALIRAAQAYAETGTLPAPATSPELYAKVRGGQYFTPAGADWIAAYHDQIAAHPLKLEDARAAE